MRPSAFPCAVVLALFLAPTTALAGHGAGEMQPVGHTMWRGPWSWTLIDERGLALGGGGLDASDVEDLKARGFGAILNYRGEHPHERDAVEAAGLEYLFINSTFAEADMMPVEELEAAVAFIERNLAEGRPVYVHCTGGLHRSAAGVIAYYMKTEGWRYDEAYAHVKAVRPSIMPWFSEALLGYEQHLFGGEKLTVDLWTTHNHLGWEESVPVHVLVTDRGAPVAGARVTYLAETGATTHVATTDAHGRALFTFAPAEGPSLQFVSARAALDGHVDGYDRNAFWVDEPEKKGPTVADVAPLPERVAPGASFTLRVAVREVGGGATNARIAITTGCGTLYREFTGWDGKEDILLVAPDAPGTYALRIFVNRFPAEPVAVQRTLVVGEGGPDPCAATPPSLAPAQPEPAPEVRTTAEIPAMGAGMTLIGLVAAFALVARRARAQDGRAASPRRKSP